MNVELKQHCRLEIQDLEFKGLIQKSRSPWSCVAFYVNKNSEIERGAPRLVINYKPLNKALKWIRYPIPNKKKIYYKNCIMLSYFLSLIWNQGFGKFKFILKIITKLHLQFFLVSMNGMVAIWFKKCTIWISKDNKWHLMHIPHFA